MKDPVGVELAIAFVLSIALFPCAWLLDRRAKRRIRDEKMTGRLPIRRSPPPPPASSASPILTVTLLALWAFLPVVTWLAATLLTLFTPPATRIYLPPAPTFWQALRWTLGWCLFWAGLPVLGWITVRLGNWLTRRLAEPAASRAHDQIQAGNLDEAVRALRDAIEANGPSLARSRLLADALILQERWLEALEVSLAIDGRGGLDFVNRRRKALALCKLGLPEVALAQLNPSNAKDRGIEDSCSYCQALIDLGLFDHAWYPLRRAEEMFGRGTFPRDQELQVRAQIDACRTRLETHFVDKKPARFDEI